MYTYILSTHMNIAPDCWIDFAILFSIVLGGLEWSHGLACLSRRRSRLLNIRVSVCTCLMAVLPAAILAQVFDK